MEKVETKVKELTLPNKDEEREARLAQALRDNLRRRKAQARDQPPPSPPTPEPDRL